VCVCVCVVSISSVSPPSRAKVKNTLEYVQVEPHTNIPSQLGHYE